MPGARAERNFRRVEGRYLRERSRRWHGRTLQASLQCSYKCTKNRTLRDSDKEDFLSHQYFARTRRIYVNSKHTIETAEFSVEWKKKIMFCSLLCGRRDERKCFSRNGWSDVYWFCCCILVHCKVPFYDEFSGKCLRNFFIKEKYCVPLSSR